LAYIPGQQAQNLSNTHLSPGITKNIPRHTFGNGAGDDHIFYSLIKREKISQSVEFNVSSSDQRNTLFATYKISLLKVAGGVLGWDDDDWSWGLWLEMATTSTGDVFFVTMGTKPVAAQNIAASCKCQARCVLNDFHHPVQQAGKYNRIFAGTVEHNILDAGKP
jgi:hypothetical protein